MKTLALFLSLALAGALNAQTSLDKKPSSAGEGAFENMFDRRAREAKEREAQAQQAQRAKFEALRKNLNEMGAKLVQGKVLSVVKEGSDVLVQCGATYHEDPKCYLTGTLENFPRAVAPDGLGNVVILLKTPPALGTLVDGDPVNVIAGPTTETYHYTTAIGGAATVRVYGMALKK